MSGDIWLLYLILLCSSYSMFDLLKSRLKKTLVAFLLVALFLGMATPASYAALPSGNAITDGKALLRYALPIDNKAVRQLQTSLEDISNQLRANKRWSAIASDLKKASRIIDAPNKLLASIPETDQTKAQSIIDQIKTDIESLQQTTELKDKEQTLIQRAKTLNLVGELEQMMVKGFPYEVPTEYSNLPQLKGRATVAIKTNKGDLTVVADGYSAPITAGNFVDLVKRGFYNGLEFTRSEESYVLQTGDPAGKEVGFIDPKTKQYRAIPFEVLVEGDKQPTYGTTLEEAGRYTDMPVLPFSSFGAMALARPERDVNGGSSQFFFFLFEPELTPAGRNLLDGRYAIFGYLTEGRDVLDALKAGDKIESAKIVDGLENLMQPTA
jgi:peptidylprolyl isomerase